MNEIELILLNFKEIRRRSSKVWSGIPEDKLDWRPDEEALSCAEMIRHVLNGEYLYYQILLNRGSIQKSESPYDSKKFISVEDEIEFSRPYTEEFYSLIKSFSQDDLKTIQIDRSDVGYIRSLGDMLLRIAYHEAVHTGQMLDYMRTFGADRPNIWD